MSPAPDSQRHACQWCGDKPARKVTISPAVYRNKQRVRDEIWGWACDAHVMELEAAKRESRPRPKVHAEQISVFDFPEVFA